MPTDEKVLNIILRNQRELGQQIKYATAREPLNELRIASIAAVDSPYAPDRQGVVLADATLGNIIVNLPQCSTRPGRAYSFHRIDGSANTVTITPFGAETIDGAPNLALAGAHSYRTIVNNGSNWYSI